MTLAALTPRIAFAGSGTRGPFNLVVGGTPIVYSSASHIRAVRYDAAGAAAALTEGVHYDSAFSGGSWSITLRTTQPVLAVGEVLVVDRVQPFAQDLDLGAETFPAEALEARLDRVVQYCQDLMALVGRSITTHPADAAGLQIPNATARANTLFGWNGAGVFTPIPQASFAASGAGSPPMAGTAQPLDASLTGLAALAWNANTYAFGTGVDTFALGTITANARALLADTDVPRLGGTAPFSAKQTLNAGAAIAAGLSPASALDVGTIGWPVIRTVLANFTPARTDAGAWIASATASALTCTLPANATVDIPIGVPIRVGTFGGCGAITFSPGAGASLVFNGATAASCVLATNRFCYAEKWGANEWTVYGYGGLT